MADNTKYYVLKGDKTLAEGLTKEEIFAAITQAVEGHSITDVDTGFVTTLKEQNKNTALKFWVGTQAQYNALAEHENNVLYLITDDNTTEDLEEFIERLDDSVDNLQSSVTELQSSVTELQSSVTELQSSVTELQSVLYYKIGDKGSFTFKGTGFFTTSKHDLYFTTTTAKKLRSGQKFKLTWIDCVQFLQNGKYVGDTYEGTGGPTFAETSLMATITDSNQLIVRIRDNDLLHFGDVMNNCVAGVYVIVEYEIVKA